MRKITLNNGDWTGRETTVTIENDGSFKLFGEKYQMIRTQYEHSEDSFEVLHKNSGNHVAKGFELKYEKLTHLDCFVFYDEADNVERTHKSDPYIAALQVLFMIL